MWVLPGQFEGNQDFCDNKIKVTVEVLEDPGEVSASVDDWITIHGLDCLNFERIIIPYLLRLLIL